MVPWSSDALLPTAQRYASDKFRRVAGRLEAHRLDYAEAAELVAFLSLMTFRHASYIFHWKNCMKPKVDALVAHIHEPEMARENLARIDRADGLAMLAAMQDGGFTRGGVPNAVRMALLELRDDGMSHEAVGKLVGLPREQVKHITARITTRPVPLLGLLAG